MAVIYFNNAATSHPKPPDVYGAVAETLAAPPVEPGRAGAGEDDPVDRCRRQLATFFSVADPGQVTLLPSATHALNLVITGLLGGGGHAVTTTLEHTSVLRPLAHLGRDRGVETTHLDPDATGRVPPEAVADALRAETRLVALTHAANVTGSIQPVQEIAGIAARRQVPLLLDASQSAGAVEIDYQHLPGRVYLAFAGHKGLLAPTGVGGLVVPDDELPQTVVGGTGVRSESLLHPPELPLRHEAGTPNLPGLAGLAAALTWLRQQGIENQGRHRHELVTALRQSLRRNRRIKLCPLAGDDGRAGIVTFNLEGWRPEELAHVLRESFGIETRPGLHCAPLAHQHLGTAPLGAVRVSFGPFNTADEVEHLVTALKSISGS
jgi:cysteine desulfurase family protein